MNQIKYLIVFVNKGREHATFLEDLIFFWFFDTAILIDCLPLVPSKDYFWIVGFEFQFFKTNIA